MGVAPDRSRVITCPLRGPRWHASSGEIVMPECIQ